MATALTSEYAHVTRRPDVCGGAPCIAGTRIRVLDVVVLYAAGRSIEAITGSFDSNRQLSPAEVHGALTFYYDHREEIDAEIEADRGRESEHELRRAEYLTRSRG